MEKAGVTGVTKTVAEHIIDFLERRDVKHVFGLCGHTNIAVLAAMAESPIDFLTFRHVIVCIDDDDE